MSVQSQLLTWHPSFFNEISGNKSKYCTIANSCSHIFTALSEGGEKSRGGGSLIEIWQVVIIHLIQVFAHREHNQRNGILELIPYSPSGSTCSLSVLVPRTGFPVLSCVTQRYTSRPTFLRRTLACSGSFRLGYIVSDLFSDRECSFSGNRIALCITKARVVLVANHTSRGRCR